MPDAVENMVASEYHIAMAGSTKTREIASRLSIPLIAIAVVLVGAIQYGWFSRAAEVEIEGEERALQATVWQAIAREFQRYAPLVGDLRQRIEGNNRDAASLKDFLRREFMLYGPSGTTPGLINSIHIFPASDSEIGSVLDSESGSWIVWDKISVRSMLKKSETSVAPGMIFVDTLSPPPNEHPALDSDGFLLVSSRGPDRTVFAIGIDADSFFEAYLKPAIAAVLPGARITWSDDRQDPPTFEPGRRAFNPISALLGLSSERSRTFVVAVPTGFGSFYRPGRDRGGMSALIGDSRVGNADEREIKGIPRMRYATVTMSPASAIGSMERRLAMNWLLGTGLLVGLGAALVLSLLQKKRLALARQREREFVASVTHELRTPVTAIRSAADNIRRGIVPSGRLASYGEMMHNEAIRLGSMIEDVILFSRVEGRSPGPAVRSGIDAKEFAKGLMEPLEAVARSEGVSLAWDFGALPATIVSDAESLRLILSNLVANAIYHAYSGTEKGSVRIVGRIGLPSTLRFTVEDDGRGIAKQDARPVFEAFYRDSTSKARGEKGTGLGLYIARRKARELGGDISLESPYRRLDGAKRPGCRFVLELPLGEEEKPC